jgi:hypothetical protein
MHFLASHYRSEFLATPQLVRFEHAKGGSGLEPTLLIKASTLLLKYIVQGVRTQLVFSPLDERLLYGVRIFDDALHPSILWSLVERQEEVAAIRAISRSAICHVFLFNELAVNVASNSAMVTANVRLQEMIKGSIAGRVDYTAIREDAVSILDSIDHPGKSDSQLVIIDLAFPTRWNPIHSHYITSHLMNSPIDLFSADEGGQQEHLAIWLTDALQPFGVHHAPLIPQGKGSRELTDVLLTYKSGSFLIESKTLAIFGRNVLPGRSKLAHDLSRHITKALNQLRGGVRRIKDGTPIVNKEGVQLEVERTQPVHAIVMVPDLELITDQSAYSRPLIKEFMARTGGFLHMLDVAELLRVVQAAEMIAERSTSVTPMMAFDYYLMERTKQALKANTLCVRVLLRFTDQ